LGLFSKDYQINGLNSNQFKDRIQILENEIQQLKNQIRLISKKTVTSADRIKSVKDLKKELKAFFSLNGYSTVLDTQSLIKKVFWFSCMITLVVLCSIIVERNYRSFQSNEVVTQIKNIYSNDITFPAVTFYIEGFRDKFVGCFFESTQHPCKIDEFEIVQIDFPLNNRSSLVGYKFNGGKNSSNYKTNVLESSKIGIMSGLSIELNSSVSDTLWFHVGENTAKPLFFEFDVIKLNQKGKAVYVQFKKIVDIKLPKPYSNCIEVIDSETSHLVKQILENNVSYRQEHCYEMCYYLYLEKYATLQNMSKTEAYVTFSFDYKGNCSHLCPLECSSTSFAVNQAESESSENDRRITSINFYYSERKYTVISQTVKTEVADFVSSNGGVLGLFLELSFLSAYRCIIFIFDVILA